VFPSAAVKRAISRFRLSRGGSLADGSICTLSWPSGSSIGLSTRGDQCTLLYTEDGEPRRQTITLDYTPCHYGGQRAWFECPNCWRRCARLSLGSSGFYCRKCYRLPYYTQQRGEIDRLIHKKLKIEDKRDAKRLRKATRDRLWSEWIDLDIRIDDMIEARFGQWWTAQKL